MTALELADVRKRYRSRMALDGVSFSLPVGATVGLLGPNGAGKTTALRLALGFARTTGGQVRLRGRDPQSPEARVGVGYLPERMALPARSRVAGFLRLHARLLGLSGAALEREVDVALELVGVADRRNDPMGSLSKGLAQRVGFAQAWLGKPDVLLLDEPTSGLDPLGIRDAREWIVGARERGCSVLISSHVLSEVEQVCDEVVILHGGRVAASGTVADVLDPGESLEDAFVRLVRG